MMRSAIKLIAGIALLALTPAYAASDREARGEAELAKAIEGRTAGEPVKCLNTRDIRSTRVIDRTAILYEMRGGTIYVNKPESGARQLDRWTALVTRTSSPQLCDVDIVRLYDTTANMETGSVSLGRFVPYRKSRG